MRILTCIIVILLATVGPATAQISFFKIFSGSGYDFGHGITQLEDSSYAVTGSSSSFSGSSQAFLLKLDKFGEYEWSQHYGGFESEEGRRILYKENVGFYICGTTNSYGNGAFDFYLMKADINGNQEWETTFGDFGWEKVYDAALTRDTGVLMVGETNSNATDNQDLYLVRTDKDGNLLWDLTLGGTGDDKATTIKQYNDSSFIVGGYYFNSDSLLTKGVLYKIVDDGTVLDTIYLGDNGNYGVNDVEVVNGEIQVVGIHEGGNSIGDDEYLWRLDLASHVVLSELSTIFDGDGSSVAISSYGDDSRRYIAYQVGGPWAFEGGPDLAYGNYNGNLIWLETAASIADYGLDEVGDLIKTSDGGAISVGSTAGPGEGVSAIFVIKFGPNEQYPSTSGVTVNEFVGTFEIGEISGIKIFPVPADKHLIVEVDHQFATSYQIISVSGKLINEGTLVTSNSIDVSELTDGFYILQLKIGSDNFVTAKFQVIH